MVLTNLETCTCPVILTSKTHNSNNCMSHQTWWQLSKHNNGLKWSRITENQVWNSCIASAFLWTFHGKSTEEKNRCFFSCVSGAAATTDPFYGKRTRECFQSVCCCPGTEDRTLRHWWGKDDEWKLTKGLTHMTAKQAVHSWGCILSLKGRSCFIMLLKCIFISGITMP